MSNFKKLTTAILGTHTLGSAKQNNSGYEGQWTNNKNLGKFNNDYYISMLTKGWAPQIGVGDNINKTQWKRIDKGI